MKKITLITGLLLSIIANGQYYIDMTEELGDMTGNTQIDGNALKLKHGTTEQIIITANDMVLNDRSSFMLRDVIVQLSGKIVVKGDCRYIINGSKVLTKNPGKLKSENILKPKNFEKQILGNIEYFKNLEGNPQISVYAMSGQRVAKGTKEQLRSKELPISFYDLKVEGVEFKNKLLVVEL